MCNSRCIWKLMITEGNKQKGRAATTLPYLFLRESQTGDGKVYFRCSLSLQRILFKPDDLKYKSTQLLLHG